MRVFSLFFAVLFAMATVSMMASRVVAEPTEAEAKAAQEQQEKDEKYRRELGYFSRSVELDDEQKDAMVEALKKREAALASWDQTNRQRFRDYREQARDARKDGDQEAVKEVWSDARKLMGERRALQSEYNQKIMDVMTDAQQLTYRQALLGRFVDRQLQGFEMTEEQQTLRDELVEAGAKKIGKVEADKRWGVMREESSRIVKAVRETMTEEQEATAKEAAAERRAAWEKRRAEWRERNDRPRRGGEGRGERPEKSDRSDKAEKPAAPSSGSGGVDF